MQIEKDEASMYCPNCRNQVFDGAEFCPSCGTNLKEVQNQIRHQFQNTYQSPINNQNNKKNQL